MKTLILSCILLASVFNLFGNGYNQLTVGDPRNGWWTNQGTIEEASLTVHPKGLFMEYGLYLTFSSKNSNWTSATDTVEVTLRFDLPENAIIHDSWLWIEDSIVKAKILDRWSATATYENIVRRRRDPSILLKQTATQYELRIFPMAGNQTRKVKITYLMPATWNKTNVISEIPTGIINTSFIKPANFPVLTWTDSTWINPQIVNNPEIAFAAKSDTVNGDHFEANIPASKYADNLTIGFDSPLENGLYLSGFQQGDEGIYQLAIFPDQLFDAKVIKKAAFLIDYDESNTSVSSKELLNTVKNEMLMNLSSKDSFNILCSNLSIVPYSNTWVAASKANIEDAFHSLNNPLSSYSNLSSLLVRGIEFVKRNGYDGKIILISDADQYGDFQVANKLTNDLMKLMNPKIPIHISDYQTINFQYYYRDGQSYFGNDYFYSTLSRMTLGSNHAVRNNLSISEAVSASFKYLGGAINSFDLHTSLKNGFCHSRYTMPDGGNTAYVDEAILQVGKFKGEFPFLIEISGEYNNEIFSNVLEVEKPLSTNDTISETLWTGQYIKKLESGNQSNDVINEIVFSSLNMRVLSKYTSFLCVEDTNMICNNCVQQGQITTEVKEPMANQDPIIVYPNPFVEKLSIEITCSNPEEVTGLSIVDVTGSLIHEFSANEFRKGKNVMTWNGTSSRGERVKPGVYLLVYKTAGYSKTIKILRK
jgi:hypothetical protein